MKTTLLSLVLVAFVAFGASATEPQKKLLSNAEQQNELILSPELESLFLSERLSEAVVRPTYLAAEQIIFREQIKQLKDNKGRKKNKSK